MRIDFGSSGWVEIPRMNGGQGSVFAKMAVTENTRIVLTRIPPGSSIGLHRQASGDDVNYVLEGTGKAVCDGKEERLSPGVCHVCPKGSEHSIENDGSDDLVLFTAVPVTGARCRGWQGKRSSEPLPAVLFVEHPTRAEGIRCLAVYARLRTGRYLADDFAAVL